ncbi:MAG: NYN domain-containing protein [Geminicoccaceae bacterium]|jgi:uncharacterized LabA/DUF88 family protein|nr:NYN domain-containing protein [Geminicoccaceae bacterium]HRY27261.1 NYN domain-containing protein [Geminicoccaceae bacterium]
MARPAAFKHFHPDERFAVFIDGANLYQTAKALGYDVDYRRLLEVFSGSGRLLRAYYYTALLDEQEYSPIRPLVDWLDYNGYTMVTKPLKEFSQGAGRRKFKGNMDVELTVDVMEVTGAVDHVVLMTGDGDFRRLVEAVQRRGVKVSVISTIKTQPPMIADELRRQADFYVELADLTEHIARAHAPRPAVTEDPEEDEYEEEEYEDDDDDVEYIED